MVFKKTLEKNIVSLHGELHAAHLKIIELTKQLRYQQNTTLEETTGRILEGEQQVHKSAENFLLQTFERLKLKVAESMTKGGLHLTAWNSPEWIDLQSTFNEPPPNFVRIGELQPQGLAEKLPVLPALLPIIQHNNTYILSSRSLINEAANVINSIAWRISAFSSPDTYRFLLIDSMDRGKNLAELLNLPEVVRGKKVYCQDAEIEELLKTVTKEIEEITQKRLVHTFDNVEDYNKSNPHLFIPYRFIFLTSYPKGLTSQSLELLTSIARTGRAAGVYLVMNFLSDNNAQRGRNDIEELLEYGNIVSIDTGKMATWDDKTFANFPVKLDEPPANELIELISILAKQHVESASDILEFPEIALEQTNWWKLTSISGLIATVGLDANGVSFPIELGPKKDTFHALVGGRTGGGKSNFLHTLILSLVTTYSYEELELYLVDFKEGVEFQDYAKYALPHAKAIVIEAEREYGLSILSHLDSEIERRSSLFKTHANHAVNIQNFRTNTGMILPRIVVIIDEFVRLFEENDALSDLAYGMMIRIANLGRAYGIHLVLAAQRPLATYQNLSQVKSQINLRIAFKCNDPDDSVLILGENNESAARLEQIGNACITTDPTIAAKTISVKIGYVSQDDRGLYLSALGKFAQAQSSFNPQRAVVFQKHEPCYWENNEEIQSSLSGIKTESRQFWLGQPLQLAPDVKIILEHQGRDNVLILGTEEQFADENLLSCLVGLLLTTPPQTGEFHFLNSGSLSSNKKLRLDSVLEKCTHSVVMHSDLSVLDAIDEISLRLEERLAGRDAMVNIYIFIPGLQHLRGIKGENEYTASEAGVKLANILKDGPPLGIHTFVWTDRLSTLTRITGDNSILDIFRHRIAMHMTVDESNMFIGTPDAKNLGTSKVIRRALYRNEDKPDGTVQKIKPYSILEEPALSTFIGKIEESWKKDNE